MRPLFEARDVTVGFDGLLAVNHLSLEVFPGEVAALVGPNGAGKTTLMNVAGGFLSASHGRILFRGNDITGWPPDRVARLGIARTFQDLRLARGLSVLENVLLARPAQTGELFLSALLRSPTWRDQERRAREAAMRILERVGLPGLENNLARDLSYGQQKLLTLACCLSAESELLLLDEPFSGIHQELIKTLIGLLRELAAEAKTVLFIEHNIEAVKKLADKVIVMNQGAKVDEGPPDVLNMPKTLEIYLR
jgi:ABC-type branched-subunit amino acid transport system ATPase component